MIKLPGSFSLFVPEVLQPRPVCVAPPAPALAPFAPDSPAGSALALFPAININISVVHCIVR